MKILKEAATIGILKLLYCILMLIVPMICVVCADNATQSMWTVSAVWMLLLCCAILVNSGIGYKTLCVLVWFLVEPVNLIEIGWVIYTKTILLQQSFWVVFDTNVDETVGFLSTLPAASIACGVLHFLLSTGVLLCIVFRPYEKKGSWRLIGMLLLVGIVGIVSISPIGRRNVYAASFYNSLRKYILDKREIVEFYKNRDQIKIESHRYISSGKATLVVVIGESANRHHYGIYGYGRNTTPLLDSIANELVVYKDVISPNRATLNCMKEILTFANYEQPKQYVVEASIVEILCSAGYKTFWIDNQGVGGKDDYVSPSYRVMAKMCDYFYVLPEISFDEKILPYYRECLSDTASAKVIFLHLIGSHFPYEKNAPGQYLVYTDTTGIESPYKDQLTPTQVDVINTYDATVNYNDWIIKEIIDCLRSQEGASALLYFSDHGEEMCETYQFCGRSPERLSRSQGDIPFVLWRNQEYCDHVDLYIAPQQEYCTDDVIHSIMDLAGVSYHAKDTTRSVFSSKFIPKNRVFEGTLYDSLPAWKNIQL